MRFLSASSFKWIYVFFYDEKNKTAVFVHEKCSKGTGILTGFGISTKARPGPQAERRKASCVSPAAALLLPPGRPRGECRVWWRRRQGAWSTRWRCTERSRRGRGRPMPRWTRQCPSGLDCNYAPRSTHSPVSRFIIYSQDLKSGMN